MDLEATQLSRCNVSGVHSFFYRLSQIAGMAALRFDKDGNNWCMGVSRRSNMYSKVVGSIFMIFTILGLVTHHLIDGETPLSKTNGSRVLKIAAPLTVSITVMIGTFTAFTRMNCTIYCYTRLKQITEVLDHSPRTSPSRAVKLWIAIILTILYGCLFLFLSYRLLLNTFHGNNSPVIMSIFHMCHLIHSVQLLLVVIGFVLLTTSLLRALQTLNKGLMDLLRQMKIASESMKSTAQFGPNCEVKYLRQNAFLDNPICYYNILKHYNEDARRTARAINRFSHIFCSLCDIARQIDKSNGLLLAMLLLSLLVQLVATIYDGVIVLCAGHCAHIDSDYESGLGFLEFVRIIYQFGKLLAIVEPFDRALGQMVLTRKLVNHMGRYIPLEAFAVNAELKMFHRHIVLNQTTFSPLQLFTLNRTLILTLLGSVTTYVVIIMQL